MGARAGTGLACTSRTSCTSPRPGLSRSLQGGGSSVATGASRKKSLAPVLLDRLALLKVEDREAIREVAAAIRGIIEGIAVPEGGLRAVPVAKAAKEEAAQPCASS